MAGSFVAGTSTHPTLTRDPAAQLTRDPEAQLTVDPKLS
jgi:hypothetical protein